ncbi:12561_t:CDS:2 [Gigaspora margarita]|uniref:12561_t:CDS:1 n=1 Tax=Gigaspora margarita TaxID=4874 RepID=A0ABN7V032_GIGMA|nr:12561_t:CDS:2 [Gigaspora margarita]
MPTSSHINSSYPEEIYVSMQFDHLNTTDDKTEVQQQEAQKKFIQKVGIDSKCKHRIINEYSTIILLAE